jgi:hypothetical protein
VKHIEALNRRFADALGYVGGTHPRWKWALSTECHYYIRDHAASSFKQYCWADRIGRRWLLCQWSVPTCYDPASNSTRELTESDWWVSFNGTVPFPKNGEYIAHAETALPPGREPTPEHTAYYIMTLDQQMSTSFWKQLDDQNLDLALMHRQRDYEFDCKINEAVTRAFDPRGNRGDMIGYSGGL